MVLIVVNMILSFILFGKKDQWILVRNINLDL